MLRTIITASKVTLIGLAVVKMLSKQKITRGNRSGLSSVASRAHLRVFRRTFSLAFLSWAVALERAPGWGVGGRSVFGLLVLAWTRAVKGVKLI